MRSDAALPMNFTVAVISAMRRLAFDIHGLRGGHAAVDV
jgi:hypothetical protein